MAVTPELITQVRTELQDNETGLYILDDSTITYFLTKHNESVQKASIDCARAILMRLSMHASDEVVDVLSIKSSKSAEQYRLALELYLKNPQLNPIYQGVQGWVGGISKSEMLANDEAVDNNFVKVPSQEYPKYQPDYFSF